MRWHRFYTEVTHYSRADDKSGPSCGNARCFRPFGRLALPCMV